MVVVAMSCFPSLEFRSTANAASLLSRPQSGQGIRGGFGEAVSRRLAARSKKDGGLRLQLIHAAGSIQAAFATLTNFGFSLARHN
jgi:hypothetical protein